MDTGQQPTKLNFKLNPQQEEAVQYLKGPLLISAGAGSGKTKVLIDRMSNILNKRLCLPNEILAVTFTNKATREMIDRIYQSSVLEIPITEPWWIHTFHAASARILRENIEHLTPRTQVAIYDDSDQLSLIKKIMKDLSIDSEVHPAKSFQHQISMCKTLGLFPDQIEEHPTLRFTPDFAHFYTAYEEALLQASAFDFEGLLLEVYKLFTQNKAVLTHYQNKFKYVCVDEYQDTNHIQYLLIKLLAKKHQNICVVGDEDQSIYSWRGADIFNILNFEQDFPSCKVIKLEQNYRSTKNIVSAASSLINYNHSRKSKKLFTENTSGDLVHLQSHYDDIAEAQSTIRTLYYLCESGEFSFNDIAIFYRTNSQSRVIEDQLRRNKIPYEMVGHLKFYDRAEVKTAMSYLKVIVNTNDEVSLRRSLGTPKKGIGASTLNKANTYAATQGCSLYQALSELSQNKKIPNKAATSFLKYKGMIESFQEKRTHISIHNLYLQVLEESGFLPQLQDAIESSNKVENLAELGNAIQQFEESCEKTPLLEQFLEEISLATSDSQRQDSSIKLMTLHLSKGLEFDVVFITGLEEGLLPLTRSSEDTDMEEERRLTYVGMTRAKKKLFLSYAKKRNRFGIEKMQLPSRFIKEISKEYLQVIDPVKSFHF